MYSTIIDFFFIVLKFYIMRAGNQLRYAIVYVSSLRIQNIYIHIFERTNTSIIYFFMIFLSCTCFSYCQHLFCIN